MAANLASSLDLVNDFRLHNDDDDVENGEEGAEVEGDGRYGEEGETTRTRGENRGSGGIDNFNKIQEIRKKNNKRYSQQFLSNGGEGDEIQYTPSSSLVPHGNGYGGINSGYSLNNSDSSSGLTFNNKAAANGFKKGGGERGGKKSQSSRLGARVVGDADDAEEEEIILDFSYRTSWLWQFVILFRRACYDTLSDRRQAR